MPPCVNASTFIEGRLSRRPRFVVFFAWKKDDKRGPRFVTDPVVRIHLSQTDVSRFIAAAPGPVVDRSRQAFSTSSTRLSMTLSTRPNSWAPSAVKNWSRSSASSILLIAWPVCLT